jgi:pimeloyl-ACP methyl ester carboxylesterase
VSAIVDRQVRIFQAIGSPAYPTDETVLRERVLRATERSYYPDGEARQGAAALAAGDRRAELRRIVVPTVVVHGADDPFVPVEAGRDVASTIPAADLRVIAGMGHDMPAGVIDTIADAIVAAAARGRQRLVPAKR